MWLKSVTLKNVKCFSDTTLDFSRDLSKRSPPEPYRWITLLGENGVGKSTLLQSIALLLAGPEAAKELLPRPVGWLRDQSEPAKLTAEIRQNAEDEGNYGAPDKPWHRETFSYSYYVTGDREIRVPLVGRREQKEETYTEPAVIEESGKILSWLRVNAFASGNKGWFAAGYGPFRRLTRSSQILIPRMEALTRASNFSTQFNEDSPLSSFERWMVYLDFRQAKDTSDELSRRMRRIGEKAVTALLPRDVEISEVTKDGLVNFKIDGRMVPSIGLSDGFRSVIALAGDLIWRLLQSFSDMEDPTQATGVVLIDELDIHLHPIWQRDIATWLTATFPNLQFIVATHSPMIAIGAGEDALTIRFEMDESTGEVKTVPVEDIFLYDVDQALRSPAFKLVSTYSPHVQKKIDRYHQLRLRFETQSDLSDSDKQLLDGLTELMRRINLGAEAPEKGTLQDRVNRFLEEYLPQ
jgi:hypothetical protein